MRFENKVALVTGASKGIGRATAALLAAEGASVVLTGRDEADLEETADLVRSAGGSALITTADLRETPAIDAMVDKAVGEYGRIDILINNAGGALFTPVDFESLSEDDWDLVVDTNLRAVFVLTKAILPAMRSRQYGRLVHIASVAGRTNSGGMAGTHYVSAKAGLMGFSKQIAFEYGQFNITSNVVAPGLIMSTDRVKDLWATRDEAVKRQFLDTVPLGRPGEPEEIAYAAAFLASDQAAYITGATIDVNGGRLMA
jgi:3-oxoacyl-[acyl-carrier protein] reductase